MEKSNEVYDIPECPLCKKKHRYSLIVMRSSFLYGAAEASGEKRVRRLLTCPTTGEDFEAVIVLQDDPKNKIASVAVEGLFKEKK